MVGSFAARHAPKSFEKKGVAPLLRPHVAKPNKKSQKICDGMSKGARIKGSSGS